MNMLTTIGLIIYSAFIFFIGYVVGRFTTEDYAEEACRESRFLRAELKRYKLFAPISELHKREIIQMHNRGICAKDIGAKFGIKKSTVTAALRKRGYGKKYNN